MVAQLLLGLGLLVFVHELGHFLAAKAFGIKVEKFYVFFDFGNTKIFSKKVGDTEYGIGWFPLGGYVKIVGMVDESMDKDQLEKPPEDYEFRSKPAWQRFIVLVAGVVMNVIVGILIFAGSTLYFDKEYVPISAVENGIYAHEIARNAGLKTGDKITKINGRSFDRAKEVESLKMLFGAKVTLERNGQTKEIQLPDNLFLEIGRGGGQFISFLNVPFEVSEVMPGTPAEEFGLQKGDQFLRLDTVEISSFGHFSETLSGYAGQEIEIEVKRSGETFTDYVKVGEDGRLGFFPNPLMDYDTKPYTVFNSLKYGTIDGFEAIYYNAIGLGKVFTGQVKATESIQSPIGIATIYGGVWDWKRFWYLTGLISFILAFMNILPIPALDGGHIMFIFIEVIQGKPVSQKTMEKAQGVGMVLLLLLMAFAFGNDIYKLITGG